MAKSPMNQFVFNRPYGTYHVLFLCVVRRNARRSQGTAVQNCTINCANRRGYWQTLSSSDGFIS
jgi:hypothetical protein